MFVLYDHDDIFVLWNIGEIDIYSALDRRQTYWPNEQGVACER